MEPGPLTQLVKRLARECGFDLVGVAQAKPVPQATAYADWVEAGMAGEMHYLSGHRAEIRMDPKLLFPPARSIICVGKLYNGPEPHSTEMKDPDRGWISRYAWGDDYHGVLRAGLRELADCLKRAGASNFEWKACVDTAPILEVAYARQAGLGWIGKNTCLINQQQGSWFFLGELLTSLDLEPDSPPPDRCGTCTRCIDACPTNAIVPMGAGFTVDARRCISYLTIELRGPIPEQYQAGMGSNIFGCDICQDVCPWNRQAPTNRDLAFKPRLFAPPLEELSKLTETRFRALFKNSPIARTRHQGLLRNVAAALERAPDCGEANRGREDESSPTSKR